MVRPFEDDPPAPSEVFKPDKKLCNSDSNTFDTSSFLPPLSFFLGAVGVTTGTALFGVSGVAADVTAVVAGVAEAGGVEVVDVRAEVLELSDGRLNRNRNEFFSLDEQRSNFTY